MITEVGLVITIRGDVWWPSDAMSAFERHGDEEASDAQATRILRQKWVLERSHRAVAASVGVSAGAVAKVVGRADAAEFDWATVEGLGDEALEERLYGARTGPSSARPQPDPVWIHVERKKLGVTLELLHLE